jgi:hypothetical protein
MVMAVSVIFTFTLALSIWHVNGVPDQNHQNLSAVGWLRSSTLKPPQQALTCAAGQDLSAG